MFHKLLLLSLLTATLFNTQPIYATGIGLKYTADPKTVAGLQGAWILGHLGLNIMSIYFHMAQIGFLEKIPYPNNELGVPEEQKLCSITCQANSNEIRKNAYSTSDLLGIATGSALISALFNTISFSIWAGMIKNWDSHTQYEPNLQKTMRVATGASVFTAFTELIASSLTFVTLSHYIDSIPLRTLAPLQVAVTTGIGYWVPMLVFSGHGIVRLAELAHAFSTLAHKGADWLDRLPTPIQSLPDHQP